MLQNNRNTIKNFILRFLTDSILVMIGVSLINVISQFIIYPIWNEWYDNEIYGKILFLISGMNVLAITVGMACNYGRMKMSASQETHNDAYNRILLLSSTIALPYITILYFISGVNGFTVFDVLLLWLLTILTMWRMYSDVEYRLSTNYKGCFFYYLTIASGYVLGIFLFSITRIWQLSLLPGELLGLLVVWTNGKVLKKDNTNTEKKDSVAVVKSVVALIFTDLISIMVLNGDRFLLNFAVNATAISIYYQASLGGKAMSLVTAPLNSVIIGHLSKYKNDLSIKFMNLVSIALGCAFVIASIGLIFCSHIIITILYPQNYELVKGFFLIAITAQVAESLSGIAGNILLRFCNVRYLLYVNIVYLCAFIVLCVPSAILFGLDGFAVAFFATCFIRLVYALGLGYYSVFKKKNLLKVKIANGVSHEK